MIENLKYDLVDDTRKGIRKVEDFKFELEDESRKGARIKVVGIGGAGSNAVGRMYELGMAGIEFYVMNTDAQALGASRVPNKLQIGKRITSGLGAGSNPEIGRQSALEDTETILDILEGADLVFVTAGMGGGTGGGAAPVVARLARQIEALTIAIVTRPFGFEGARRMAQADAAVVELAASVDILTVVPNERLLKVAPRGTSMAQAFRIADDVLRQAVEGISELILLPGMVNLDFADIRAAITEMGHALIGMATGTGPDAAVEAARGAISSPLLEDTRMAGARQILMNITGSAEIGLHEISEACAVVREASGSPDLQLNFGVILKPEMGDAVKVTVIATGFPKTVEAPLLAAVSSHGMEESRAAGSAPAPTKPVFVSAPEAEPHTEVTVAGGYEDELDVPAILRRGRPVS